MSNQNDTKQFINSIFKSCLDILRSEGLTGDKALRNMTYLLILKLLESRFGCEIDIDNYPYDYEYYSDHPDHFTKLLHVVRFSNLLTSTVDNIPNIISYLWNDVLSVHPATQKIFLKGKRFDIEHTTTYKKLLDKIDLIPCTENDVLGDAYEEVVKDIMVGKTLGQFFTDPLIKNLMINLIEPQIYPDGKIESCCDPTMGTGGFLTTYLKNIIGQSRAKNITLDWDFIKNEGIYGKEIEQDTYQMAVSNMLISSGHMFEQLERGDSIREPITRKFDIVLANPPFGIKGLKYTEFTSSLKFVCFPIKTDNAVSLFIQEIVYILKINGRCAVVLPDGKDLTSIDKLSVTIREFLMKTCDLKEIIYLPQGLFTNTNIKTCILYFVKKVESSGILETIIKDSKKTQKEISREYKFSKTHQTNTVTFYSSLVVNKKIEKTLLVEVPIDEIANKLYSLNYKEYVKCEEIPYNDDIIVKTLGEVCKFLPKSKRHASYGEKHGEYPFYTSSQICSKYCDEYDYEDECLIIGTGGTANVKYSSKFSCSADNFVIKINAEQLVKYIYYYLSINIETLQKGFVGVGLQHISKEYINNIKIPFPSLAKQNETVKYLDFIYEKANKTSTEKIAELKQLNEFCLNNQQKTGENVVKTLGEVCQIKCGNHSTKKCNFIEGEYLIIGGGKQPIGKHNEYNCDENTILCASHGTAGYISMYPVKTFLTMAFAFIENKQLINKIYLYYYLKSIEQHLISLGKGTAQPCISMDNLKSIKIPIPSLERQQEIVEYCEYNDTLIKQLKKDIENNKKQAQEFITGIVKSQVQTEEQIDINSVNTEPIDEVQNEIISIEEHVNNDEPINVEETEQDQGKCIINYNITKQIRVRVSKTKAPKNKKIASDLVV